MSISSEQLHREVGRKVRDRRNAMGVSQDVLGKAVGLTRSSIANLEAGRQKLSVETLFGLAKALQTSPVELLPDHVSVDQSHQNLRLPEGTPEKTGAWIEKVVNPEKVT